MTDTPLYRGYRKVLEACKDDAMAWFKEQVWELLDDGQRAEINEHGWFHIRQDVDRTSQGWGYMATHREARDYFYVWKVAHPFKQHGDMRFVIRKDGTLNLKNLKDAVDVELRCVAERREKTSVREQNISMWNQRFNWSPRDASNHMKGVHVTLSDTTVGVITVNVWDTGHTKMKKTIHMDRLGEFYQFVQETLKRVKEFDA